MKDYIRENFKTLISVAVLLAATTLFICTNELIAKRLPEASELQNVSCVLVEEAVFEYTGEEIQPEVLAVSFIDKEGALVEMQQGEFTVVDYLDNVEVGMSSVEIQLNGYNGTVVIYHVFEIQPAKVTELKVSHESKESVDLSWEKAVGAEGYLVYKSVDGGVSFESIHAITDADKTSYQDFNIACNTTYYYKVCVLMASDDSFVKGEDSNVVSQLTRLDTPVLTDTACVAYDSIKVEWEVLAGAAGYQIYRSTEENGTFECIDEVTDGTITSYTDNTCECGYSYFYYIKASQALESGIIYGDASSVLSAKTIPNQVRISGSVSEDQTQVSLSWKVTSGAQGYEIFRSTGNTSNYQMVKKIEQEDVCAWTDTGLQKDTEYYYKVRAYRVVNEEVIYGSYSNSFLKEVVIVYDYSGSSDDIWAITQYAGKVPYVWGGKSSSGWDCSGFTYWIYKNHFGIEISKSAAGQARQGYAISTSDRSAWQPGDILVYSEGAGASHVAIYLGDGQLIHALSERYDTLVQDVDYYERWDRATYLIGVRRIFD